MTKNEIATVLEALAINETFTFGTVKTVRTAAARWEVSTIYGGAAWAKTAKAAANYVKMSTQ